ncbi:MAG: branched-chain amino acid ABC transporter permease/ATP-binding protein [Acidimicrobiaceae bacterium]|nr:branched-chain amino acid ABC transporter permease/ATP-binding protein [Acidimicrobiaceae bacterium]
MPYFDVPGFDLSGFDVSGPLLLLGSIFGIGYALLGIGLVLAYRSSGFINFAHGSIGLVAASMMSVVVNDYGVPYWLGFSGALIVAALLAAGVESFVVRKLSAAPKVLSMVATLGAAQALLLLALSFSKGGLGGGSFPQPPFFPEFDLTVYVSPSSTALLCLSPLVVAGLYVFLQRSRYGLAIRGAAANPDSATLAGADPRHMAMLSWALAGAIAAFAAMLIIGNQSTVTADALGPDFIVRGLAVAALARFANLPAALVSGVGIGIVEQVMASNPDATGWFEGALFVLILVGVALQVRSVREQPERWSSLAPNRRLPDAYRGVWLIRNLAWVTGAVGVAVALVVPLLISNRSAFVLSTIVAFATIGISVSFLTGLAGQLSLGQVAFAAIGAVVGVRVATETGSLILGLLCGGVTAALVSAAVGLPALRVQGLLLAIATLAFALATFSWLLRQDWAFGVGLSSRPVSALGIDLGTSRRFYFAALLTFVMVLAIAHVLRRSSFGRSLIAVRDNAPAARVLQIAPRRLLLAAYGFSGFVAGIGGVVLAMSNTFVSRSIFTPSDSINVVSLAVIGGLSELTGPLLGAAYLIGIREFFDLELSALAGLNAAWLILILEQPRGLHGLLSTTRSNFIDQIARLHGIAPVAARTEPSDIESGSTAVTVTPADHDRPAADAMLEVRAISKRFGDLVAVDDVSLQVRAGETLGLIGPNGAGKTTLFELVSGFLRPDAGTVVFAGADITGLPPEARSRAGLVRSFQNASLFPTMTARDIIFLANKRAAGHSFVVGGSAAERRIEDETAETLAMFGLGGLAEVPVSLLSTGTRRLVELAANVALRPRLLLMDEPSAGIAQAETEALGAVIAQIRDAYEMTLVVIEHDMPLLSSVCDRLVAMETGSVIAQGTPSEVQADPAVVRSYLGGDLTAIARSGPAVPLE